MLMAALRYVDVKGYNAILFRRTFADLNLPGALMDRAKDWLAGVPGVTWNGGDYRFTFPSGATLSFGYLQSSMDKYRYQGADFQFIGIDELTQIPEEDYRYLFSRLRKPNEGPLSKVPLRMRAASNPGGKGHKWVKRRFIERLPSEDDPDDTAERARRRIFIPAKLSDNPHVDQETYVANLGELDPETRAQLLEGDWDAGGTGDVFARFKHGDYRLDGAIRLGQRMETDLEAGLLPPPVGGHLVLGIDWGEHTGYWIGWPLPGGGIFVVKADELVGYEAGDAFDHIVDEALREVYELGRRKPKGTRATPPLPKVPDVLDLLQDVRYDAAGLEPMKTFMKNARARRPRLKAVKVSFGARTPGPNPKSFKRESIGYFRRLFKRANDGDTLGVAAVAPKRAAEFIRQAKALAWADADLGTIDKGDDHCFDAGVAGIAPMARRHRAT